MERVRKINDLALDLMRQGLFSDREEAIKQAEKIFSKKDYSSLNETVQEIKESNVGGETGEKNGTELELSQEKIKEILEKNSAFVVKKIKEYQAEIMGLKEEVGGLRSEVAVLKGRLNNLSNNVKAKESLAREPQQKLNAGQDSVSGSGGSDDHPRSGKYSDNEISIEKFFYSGSKPQS